MNVAGAPPVTTVRRATTYRIPSPPPMQGLGWMDAALCAQTDPDLFFPPHRSNSVARSARRICATCPVRAHCLDYALGDPDLDGIWAGTTPRERQRLRRTS